ncbi:MAG: hypothetical protein WD396_00080, partial [Pseudohongiellaceae bacterium]
MDLTRFFLYTALAVITYLMLLAWQEDYPPGIDNGGQGGRVVSEQLTPPGNPSTPSSADIPSDIPS